MTDLQIQLAKACDSITSQIGSGTTAQYIPALAQVDINKFGASIVTLDGEVATFGDAQEQFSVQSIAKTLMLAESLNTIGDTLWNRVNHEPSGNTFNSIVQLEIEKGIPRNPFINAGALVLSDVMLGKSTPYLQQKIFLSKIRDLSQDESIDIDYGVAKSEIEHAFRNTSLLSFMKSFNNIDNTIDDVLKLYCHICSLSMNCLQMARTFLFLANEGVNPLTGERVVTAEHSRQINAIMMTCGHYDASGSFALKVGLPGKSGVGGGIVTIVPNKGVITVWSPGLNTNGNSMAGTAALEAIVKETGWRIF